MNYRQHCREPLIDRSRSQSESFEVEPKPENDHTVQSESRFAGWVPLASSGSLRDFAVRKSFDLREEFGWDELVKTVAGIRDSFPADQLSNVGILVGNYGEAGAIENLGPAYHLPPPISLTNSFYLRTYPEQQPSTLIVVGWSQSLRSASQRMA